MTSNTIVATLLITLLSLNTGLASWAAVLCHSSNFSSSICATPTVAACVSAIGLFTTLLSHYRKQHLASYCWAFINITMTVVSARFYSLPAPSQPATIVFPLFAAFQALQLAIGFLYSGLVRQAQGKAQVADAQPADAQPAAGIAKQEVSKA